MFGFLTELTVIVINATLVAGCIIVCFEGFLQFSIRQLLNSFNCVRIPPGWDAISERGRQHCQTKQECQRIKDPTASLLL